MINATKPSKVKYRMTNWFDEMKVVAAYHQLPASHLCLQRIAIMLT